MLSLFAVTVMKKHVSIWLPARAYAYMNEYSLAPRIKADAKVPPKVRAQSSRLLFRENFFHSFDVNFHH